MVVLYMSLHDRCWNLGFEITTARTTLDRSLVFTVGGQVTSWLSMIWTDLATQNGSQIPIILVHTLVQFLSSCAPGTPSLTLFNPVHTNVDLPAWLQLHTCTYSVLGKSTRKGKDGWAKRARRLAAKNYSLLNCNNPSGTAWVTPEQFYY